MASSVRLQSILRRGVAIRALLALTAIAATSQSAQAQLSISATQTTGVTTATAVGGAPADVTVTSAGAINPTSGAAIELNSNNNVSVQGAISILNANNATGVLIDGGYTGSLTIGGTVSVSDSTVSTTINAASPQRCL